MFKKVILFVAIFCFGALAGYFFHDNENDGFSPKSNSRNTQDVFPKEIHNSDITGRQEDIPAEAIEIYAYVIKNQSAPDGYVGGRKFNNFEKLLPIKNSNGKNISYQEWDIYPKVKGKNRGARRVVTDNHNNGYYTPDHYQSFIKIKPSKK